MWYKTFLKYIKILEDAPFIYITNNENKSLYTRSKPKTPTPERMIVEQIVKNVDNAKLPAMSTMLTNNYVNVDIIVDNAMSMCRY